MLFTESIEKEQPRFTSAIEKNFELAYKNQTHPQDMLLVLKHTSFYDTIGKRDYIIGPAEQGFAFFETFNFIDNYGSNNCYKFAEFEKLLNSKDHEEKQKTNEIIKIKLYQEHFIYLKFWESDYIIKLLYQLTRLVNKKDYDWDYKVPELGRHKVIRKEIRDRLTKTNPELYKILKETYKPQIRNAIAHSQFFVMGKATHLLNYDLNPGELAKNCGQLKTKN